MQYKFAMELQKRMMYEAIVRRHQANMEKDEFVEWVIDLMEHAVDGVIKGGEHI